MLLQKDTFVSRKLSPCKVEPGDPDGLVDLVQIGGPEEPVVNFANWILITF